MFELTSRFPAPLRRSFRWLLLAGAIGGATYVIGQAVITPPPLIQLATEPLYMNGAKAKANLTIALSVEFPTLGQTYRDDFDINKEYVGYFDQKSCYKHVPGGGTSTKGPYFDWTGKPNASGSCGGGGFNGNFLNWATSSAIDILRYGLTGGNRTVDDENTTVVDRAYLPDTFYRSGTHDNPNGYFSEKRLPNALVASMIETSVANKAGSNDVYIYNCRDRVYFSIERDTVGSCANPFNDATKAKEKMIGPTANDRYYVVRNLVCDSNSATNRLMTYDPQTKEWHGLCHRYGTDKTSGKGKYKPVGQFQMNSESLRVSVFSYLRDDTKARYGGVMRAPMKYLGPRAFDQSFNLIPGANPRSEWNATTGVFVLNPQSGDATYGDQGYGQSGAIQYINRFGTLDPANIGKYKQYDPLTELYYESLRYLQGKQPTAEAITGLNGTVSNDKTLTENYPAYRTWTNPFAGFQDSTGDTGSCLRNSILTIADVFTHGDQSVPGNTATNHNDFARGADTNPTLNVPAWTGVVGGFESGDSVSYMDSQGRSQVTSNLNGNTKYSFLRNAPTFMTGAGTSKTNLNQQGTSGGSYHMAGLAYWANTQAFNSSFPKARVRTFGIDVNEADASTTTDFRRTRQLYLAAKYGGFDDRAAGQTGNPYTGDTNTLWVGNDGDARNYFLASDAKKFLDSLAEVFAKVVEETGSIAGGAISTQRLTSSEAAAVFQARFNPVANYWSGRVLKYPISLSPTDTILIGSTPTWEAGQVLTNATRADYGDSRNIVIGPPIGRQGIDAATPFKWTDLVQGHKDALNSMPDGTTDTLGLKRLQYLRGDQRDEQSPTNQDGEFRPRDLVLGDVVNSGLVYMGKPSSSTAGTEFRTFYEANKGRKPVVFVNANDGMLHAFYDQNGQEAFAYVPGFLPKLNRIPDHEYLHASFADATPAVGDAFFDGKWRTTLVSGVGGGAQGVYALDVTNPETFSKSSVLWEFTERDHPAMGNVIGSPQILKFRVTGSTSTTPTFKWLAVVPSGVNNYAEDGYAHAGGNPSLFLLDLAFVPTPTQGWVEGTNFWRIELPQSTSAIAKGLSGFSSVKNFTTGAVDTLYAGDLQGNLWKLDFSLKGTGSLSANAATNFTTFNMKGGSLPLFVAKASNGTSLQPITGEPAILNSFHGKKMVAFGTGKFLEVGDTTVPSAAADTFYSVMDDNSQIAGRTSLQQGSMATSGTVTVPSFTLGTPTATTPSPKSGWYVDLDASIGERQISDITEAFGKLFFGSIYPTKGSCGEGGGRLYIVDALTGSGISEESQVGVLAAPLVLRLGGTTLGRTDSTGQRVSTEKIGVITQGAKGLKASTVTGSYSYMTGRITWRQINNYQSTKQP